MATYTRDPNSLDVLKKYLLPSTGDNVSENVVENDPELALPPARSNADFAGNERLKQVLGLGPSRAIQEQRNQLTAQDQAVNQARIAANPEVSAEADKAYAEKLALAGEANRVSGQSQITIEGMKNKAAAEQEANRQAQVDKVLAGSQSGSSPEFKPSINAAGQVTFAGIPEPAQVLAQRHSATVGLAQIPVMRQLVDTLDKHGQLGPVAGRFADAATSTGLDKYLLNAEAARAFSDFKAQVKLQKGNMAMTHGGARGGGSPAMMEMFDKMMNTAQTPDAIRGALDGFERWLTTYAKSTSSDELDAADASLGVTGSPYTRPATSGYVSTDPNRGR